MLEESSLNVGRQIIPFADQGGAETFQDATLRVQQVAGFIRQRPRCGWRPAFLVPTVESVGHAFYRRRWSAFTFARFNWRDRRTVRGSSSLVGLLPNGLSGFSTNLSASAWASCSRGTFPTALLSRSAAFRRWICFPSGTRRRKSACRCLFAREDQHGEDRLLANAWSKEQRLYPLEREGSKPSIGQTRERSRAPIKRLRKQKNGQNRGALLNDPHPKAGSVVTRRLLSQLVTNRGSVAINRGRSPRRFRLSLWSFDPACVAGRSATRNISKHSGFAVPRARLGTYIAKLTPQKPKIQTSQGRHVRLIFSCNTQLESRDSIGSVARAIWTAEKPRSQPTTWIALEASRTEVGYYVRTQVALGVLTP